MKKCQTKCFNEVKISNQHNANDTHKIASPATIQNTYHHQLETAQREKMKEKINLDTYAGRTIINAGNTPENTAKVPPKLDDKKLDDKQLKLTKNRRKPIIKPKLGTGAENIEETGFMGKERKAWIYINRILSHVTEDDIKGYSQNKPGFEPVKIEVQELQFKRRKWELKSFLIKVPLEKKKKKYMNPPFGLEM
ncbi:hypothetical protein WA026_022075 [Henosepilachna vigintioctopunctata]|uniref:Uncharacterized protein n=1 Tax=Henosepilachna vigintioctopunctata TaxID=420089 RepID=A0AAW1UEC3_9CUCU